MQGNNLIYGFGVNLGEAAGHNTLAGLGYTLSRDYMSCFPSFNWGLPILSTPTQLIMGVNSPGSIPAAY